jgi:hypothetical protein
MSVDTNLDATRSFQLSLMSQTDKLNISLAPY